MDSGSLPVYERGTHVYMHINKTLRDLFLCIYVCTGITVYHSSAIRQTFSWVIWKGTQTFINLTSYVAQVSVCMLCVDVYSGSDLRSLMIKTISIKSPNHHQNIDM